MKTKVIAILAAVMFLPVSQVQALLDIYSDAVIQEGDYYDTVVNVYDTPPDHTTVDMTGGFVHNLRSYDSSIINMTGGEILTLEAYNTSIANVSGGEVYSLQALDFATVNLYDTGIVSSLSARNDFGTANIYGGNAAWVSALESGTVNIYGGVVSDYMSAPDGTINVFGYDLLKNSSGGNYGFGFVNGYWDDGASFYIHLLSPETYSNINLIPEPASLLLLLLGCILLKRKR